MVKIKISLFTQSVLAFTLVVLFASLFVTWPDNKLHIYFCDVGQGDATYIRFPGNRDMLIDGGPNSYAVLNCLGRAMPFYDRTIDIVALTHPQADHLDGLVDIVKRYTIKNFVTVEIGHTIAEYQTLGSLLQERHIPITFLWAGEEIRVGKVKMSVLWPSPSWFRDTMPGQTIEVNPQKSLEKLISAEDLNHFSLYLALQLDQFDALFTGDGDTGVQKALDGLGLFNSLPESVEVLKVPHHGSKTGMTANFMSRVRPQLSIIEVGKKNSYGHPNQEVLKGLSAFGDVLRTDINGMVVVESDGKNWSYKKDF